MDIRISSDMDEAAMLWSRLWPAEDVFGCWRMREAFDSGFRRPLHLIIAEAAGRPLGFLALSYIEEEDYYGAFPGETWNGRTWLEQNVIPSASAEMTKALWEAAPENTTVRYLMHSSASEVVGAEIDETGYLFRPPDYGWSFDAYWNTFSGKSRKRLGREIESLGEMDIGPSSDVGGDIEWMLRMNIAGFGNMSYFSDRRFNDGFEAMVEWLSSAGMLRVTTAKIRGARAAVDIGAICNSRYTVLAGATSPDHPGIAKAINLYHMRISCAERFDQTDFLCGDFGWKERFHLTPRVLYTLSRLEAGRRIAAAGAEGVEGCA